MADKVNKYDTAVKVISQRGSCAAGHKVGDEWVVGMHTPAGICIAAFNSMLASIRTLRYNGMFPGEEPGRRTVACPDAANPAVFELRRISK